MTLKTLISRLAERTGHSQAEVRALLAALAELTIETVSAGDELPLPEIGRLSARWQEPRAVRSPRDKRRIMLDGRFIPRFRPSEKFRQALSARTPQLWRDPAHQNAWRVVETLLGDLELYHPDKTPRLSADWPLHEVANTCADSFGALWTRVTRAYEQQVDQELRSQRDYLLLSAQRRWSS